MSMAPTQTELTSYNPADGSEVGSVQIATSSDIADAVARGWSAFRHSGWKERLPHRKAALMHDVARRLRAERATLAQLQMCDNGKPMAECEAMVEAAAAAFQYYAAVVESAESEVTPPRGDYVSMTVLEPYGVVLAITPWNSPIMNEAQKVAPALAAGNAVLLKPSEDTPLLADELLRICREAGLPADQLQVLHGSGEEVGSKLVSHPDVRMISFTGGTETGRAIGRIAADRIVPVALELGGKSPHVVFEDADIEHAIAAVLSGIFGSSGQSCVAGSRLFVQDSIYADFVERVVDRTRALKVGAPDEAGVEVGPLASFRHRDKVAQHVESGLRSGGRVRIGGHPPAGNRYAKGAYYLPTVIDEIDPKAALCQEEIFGPVLVALPFSDDQDLLEKANGTPFGLACGIWTGDFKRAWRVGRALDAGSVWVNTYKQSSISSPFGGFKQSGLGREKGVSGLRLYSQVKSIYFGLHSQPLQVSR